jgi:aquaporin NIP
LQVPSYVLAQVLGSMLASLTLRVAFGGGHDHFFGTTPSGSYAQVVALELIISFYLMFIVSGVAIDDRAVRPLLHDNSSRLLMFHSSEISEGMNSVMFCLTGW